MKQVPLTQGKNSKKGDAVSGSSIGRLGSGYEILSTESNKLCIC